MVTFLLLIRGGRGNLNEDESIQKITFTYI
jgi:hypothetical protein